MTESVVNFSHGLRIRSYAETDREKVSAKLAFGPVKRILLVNPPDVDASLFDFDTAKRGRANNYPCYGLGVLAQRLIQHGLEVRILNLNHEILKSVADHDGGQFDYGLIWKDQLRTIDGYDPDLIGVTCLFSVTGKSLKETCQAIRQVCKTPIAIGGVHVTHDTAQIMADIPEADFAFLHEAENALIQFLEVVNGRADISTLGQVVVRVENYGSFLRVDDSGIQFTNEMRPTGEELDVIPPFEIMDIAEHSRYGTLGSWYGFVHERTRVATALSNRGCRAACTFCNVRNFNGKGVRQRSVDSVLSELQTLKDHGIGHIIWLDDDLLMNEERAINLFNGMVRRSLGMTWDATNGVIAASLNDEVVNAAAASGCIGLSLGIESGNADILRQIRKPGTPRIFRRAAEVLKRYPQINTRALLIIGFPGETLRMILDTVALCEEMNLDWHNLAILQPWKNTPIYDAMVEKGLLGEEGKLKGDVSPYQLGPYSRQRAVEMGKIQQSHFGEKIGSGGGVDWSDLDRVPDRQELDAIWFYLNVRLNFARLLTENRLVKLQQQLTWLRYVGTRTAPDNAIILYFWAYLQKRVKGQIAHELITRIESRLNQSEYWRERFDLFGLRFSDVLTGQFPGSVSGAWGEDTDAQSRPRIRGIRSG